MFIICSSLAAVTNATIHRYMSISGLLEPLPLWLATRNVKIIMFCLQVISPLTLSGCAWMANLHTAAAMEYNVNVSL